MRARRYVALCMLPFVIVGCNTPPIAPGKPVDIPTALEQVLQGLCNFRKDQAGRKQDLGAAIDSVTVELDLTVDGSRNPPVAVAPDIQFIPTVSYGQIMTANRGSRLVITLKKTGSGVQGGDCDITAPAK